LQHRASESVVDQGDWRDSGCPDWPRPILAVTGDRSVGAGRRSAAAGASFAEALTNNGDVTVGERDGPSWARAGHRIADRQCYACCSGEGELFLPLPDQNDYVATLRVDPFPRPMSDSPVRLPVLDVVLNDVTIGSVPLLWNPERVGAYDVTLPRASVRRGRNRLVLRIQPAAAAPAESSRASRLD
jgi:hypothetical protein